ALFSGPARLVTTDVNRRPLSQVETIAEHFRTSGHPRGHGYTDWNLRTGNAYYAFDRGIVRCIVLDTVNPYGGSDGSLDEEQLRWLTAELTAGSRAFGGARDRLFVLFSHHTIGTMTNPDAPPGVRRALGPEV